MRAETQPTKTQTNLLLLHKRNKDDRKKLQSEPVGKGRAAMLKKGKNSSLSLVKQVIASVCCFSLLLSTIVQAETKIYYIHNDHLGTPQVVTDTGQSVVWEVNYTPFGVVDVTTNQVELSARFPGQYEDSESGVYYNYFRDYDPETGRYFQSDPIGLVGGINTYGYVMQNPLINYDPFGLINLQIPNTSGETNIHANPGPDVVPPGAMSEHEPHHIHLGNNDGPRVRTDTWEPYSPEDERKMSRKQKKFCKNLTDVQKSLIRERQQNVYKYGRRLMGLMALPVFGLDSMTNSCKQDPWFCMEVTPYVFDDIEPVSECNSCE